MISCNFLNNVCIQFWAIAKLSKLIVSNSKKFYFSILVLCKDMYTDCTNCNINNFQLRAKWINFSEFREKRNKRSKFLTHRKLSSIIDSLK